MVVQSTVYYIIAITAIIGLVLVFVNAQLRKYDPMTEPKGVVLLMLIFVGFVEDMLSKYTNEEITNKLGPYLGSIMVYIFISNIAGLFAMECPTSNYSVTVTLAAITCVMIEVFAIKYNGIKKYLHSYIEPFAPMIVINLISKVSTLLSLSLRLFGNIMAGSILMSVVYQLLGVISSVIPVIGNINIVAIIVAPALHFYFDLFSGVIQTYIFTTLTVAFIGKELPSEE